MSVERTEKYQLSLWKPEDRVLREDFVKDNQNIEAALNNVETRINMLERACRNMAYYIGELGMRAFESSGKALSQRAFNYERLDYVTNEQLTGSLKWTNKTLQLPAGETGSFMIPSYSLEVSDWTRAQILVLGSPGNVTLEIGDLLMPTPRRFFTKKSDGVECLAWETIWERVPNVPFNIKINFTAYDSADMTVYGMHYFVF